MKSKLKTNILELMENLLFNTIPGFRTKCEHRHSNEYIIGRKIFITIKDEIHLKCYCVEGSNSNGVREPIIHSFALDKPSLGFKIWRKREKRCD